MLNIKYKLIFLLQFIFISSTFLIILSFGIKIIKKDSDQKRLFNLDIQAAEVTEDIPFLIEEGKTEVVFNYTTDKCVEEDRPDSDAHAFVDNDGNVHLVASTSTTRQEIGLNLNTTNHSCNIVMVSHNNADPRMYDDQEWLMSPYLPEESSIVYALVHNEYHGWEHWKPDGSGEYCGTMIIPPYYHFNCWWNAINLVTSRDNGLTYSHVAPPGHNIANSHLDYNPQNEDGPIGYFTPSNIIKRDGYYYALIKSRYPQDIPIQKTCVMRTDNLADPNSWKFWDGVGFNQSTDGESTGIVCANLPEGQTPPERNVSFNTYLNKYLAFTCVASLGKCYYSLSDDLVHWTDRLEFPTQNNYCDYGSLLQPGDPTRNFEQTSRSPWLYYRKTGNGGCEQSDPLNFDYDILRTRIRFSKPEDVGKYDVLDLQMNEKKGGKTLDSSFYGNDAILSGESYFRQEDAINYLSLNETGKITISHDPILSVSNQITIETRIRTNDPVDTAKIIVQKVDNSIMKKNYGLYLQGGGRLHFCLTKNGFYNCSIGYKYVNDGSWHDLVVTYDDASGYASYYVDGSLDGQVYHGASLAEGINSNPVTMASSYRVDLDYLTIYNYVNPPPSPSSSPMASPSPSPSPNPADLDGDGQVNQKDLKQLLLKWLFGLGNIEDINQDGKVNMQDAALIVLNWGRN